MHRRQFRHWKEQQVHLDAIYTGYLASTEQIETVLSVIDTLSTEDTLLFVDPAMADHGKLYFGFDEDFARASGVKTGAYNMLIAVTVAVVIVLAMQLVGSLLISALVIFPAMSAMRVFRSFRSVVVASGAISVVCAVGGILLSIALSTPVGATVVVINVINFAVFCIVGKAVKNK